MCATPMINAPIVHPRKREVIGHVVQQVNVVDVLILLGPVQVLRAASPVHVGEVLTPVHDVVDCPVLPAAVEVYGHALVLATEHDIVLEDVPR